MRGGLEPQDPADEPASVLLERIREERADLVKRKGARAPKGGGSVICRASDGGHYEKRGDGEPVPVEVPYELPGGWEWARLGAISDYGFASIVLPENIADGAWILDLEDVEKGTGRVIARRTKRDRPISSSRRPFGEGQLLYSKLRPYLNKVLISDASGYCAAEILPIQLYGNISPRYMQRCMMSEYFLGYANRRAYGCKMPRLGTHDGRNALVPVPPLAEQRRIVTRVEKLLSLLA